MEINHYDYIADLYDIYVPFTLDIDFLLAEAKKTSGNVLELMSGTGRVSVPMIEAGVKLTCVDLSAGSNAILVDKLQKRGLQADVHRMDVRELDLKKKFDLVIIPFGSFAHITSPDDQRKVLARIQQHLVPGSIFICILGNPDLRRKAVDGQLRLFRKYALPETQGELLLWIAEHFSAEDDQIVEATQLYEEYDGQGILKRKRHLELHFRLSQRDEFEELAKAAGFKVKSLYGDYAYSEFINDSPLMIWLLEKVG